MYLIKWMILMDIKEEDKLNFTFFKDQSVNYLDFTSMMNFYRSIRWADGVYCPFCKSEDIRKKVKLMKNLMKKIILKFKNTNVKIAINLLMIFQVLFFIITNYI